MSIQKSLKNALLTGSGLVSWGNNEPTRYNQKQRQYFSPETRTFTQMMAKYSSDYVEAQMQGLDPADQFAYQTRMIRLADIVKPTAAIQRRFDDYKFILTADRDIEYIMPGSKIITLGNTWLAINPENMSGSDGVSLVRRCNAVWNFLDFYGNVVSEPIIVENDRANANDSDAQNSLLISKGYFNIICQYNDHTRQIDTNTRMILGSAAYRVTGFSDFMQEFTGDYSSVRLLTFSARYEEPNLVIDDMENHVADGKQFSWEISVSGPGSLRVGASAQFTASSSRNGATVSEDGLNAPLITYLWSSSDSGVLTVDKNGIVTALAQGSATITATLEQNPAFSTDATVTVTEAEDGVFFADTVPAKLTAYDSVVIGAAYFEDGAETDEPLVWDIFGADDGTYSVSIAEDGKSAEIFCFGYSTDDLMVRASYGEYRAEAEIALEGF